MIKAWVRTPGGGRSLLLGLSFANLDRLRAAPLDDHIPVRGAEVGLDFDIIITAGPTEMAILRTLEGGITEDTVIVTDKPD